MKRLYHLRFVAIAIATLVILGSCGGGGKDVDGILSAQADLFGALFADPEDTDAALTRMSKRCNTPDSAEANPGDKALGVARQEVAVARELGLSADDLAKLSREVTYVIDGDEATGNDGTNWVFEEGRWKSDDC